MCPFPMSLLRKKRNTKQKQKQKAKTPEYDWEMAVKQQKSNKAKNIHEGINTILHSINRL